MSSSRSNLDQLRIDRSETPANTPRRGLWIAAAALLLVAVVIGWWMTRPSVAEVRTAAVREQRLDEGGGTVLNASGYVTEERQIPSRDRPTEDLLGIMQALCDGPSVSGAVAGGGRLARSSAERSASWAATT